MDRGGAVIVLKKYAQEISDTTATIIGYGVLITDRDGVVIGSSDPGRMGQSIYEVPEVVRSRKGYIVTEEEADRVKNTKAGVTYPIEDSDGHIIGTIAITGDPDKVDPFALIVQKQAEMYLREKAILENSLYREKTLENIIKDILALDPRVTGKTSLAEKLREFGYTERRPYSAIFLDYQFPPSKTIPGQESVLHSRALSLTRSVFRDQNDISVGMGGNSILIYHALTEKDTDPNDPFRVISEKCEFMLKQMATHKISASFGIGSAVSDLGKWQISYHEAQEVLERGKIFYPSRKIFSISEHRFHELIASTEMEAREHFVRKYLARLEHQRDSAELKETIQTWCENNFSGKDTAEAMNIHRNTLQYRARKIEGLYGFSMRNFPRMMELYLALQLERLGFTQQ